jgi:hypothetical protein
MIKTRHRTTKEEITTILEHYGQGKSVAEVSIETGISHGSVFRALQKEGVTRSLSLALSNADRDDLFSDLSREDVQYWLGFLIADGYLSSVGTLVVNLAKKDEDHLRKFQIMTDSNWLELPKTGAVRSYFANKKVAERLISYGITQRKSFTVDYKPELTWHTLRGIFDGDGCVSGSHFRIHTGSKSLAISIVKFFLSYRILMSCILQRGGLYCISTGNSSELIAINNLLYEGSNIFLERKKMIFGSIIEKLMMRQSANSGNAEPLIPSQQ